MDIQVYVNLAAGAVGAITLFILKTMWDSIKSLQADVRRIVEHIPTQYVRREDFNDATARVLEVMRQYREDQRLALQRIEDKLDRKADKTNVDH